MGLGTQRPCSRGSWGLRDQVHGAGDSETRFMGLGTWRPGSRGWGLGDQVHRAGGLETRFTGLGTRLLV